MANFHNNAGTFQLGAFHKRENRLEFPVQYGNLTHTIFFESDNLDLCPNTETQIALCLYPCMKTGSDLEVNGIVSPKLLASLPRIQDFYHCWDASYQHITLRNVQAEPPKGKRSKRVALFFSGGLDCWYSLLKHQFEVSDLIFVWGLDIHLDNQVIFEKTLTSIRRVAKEFNKNLTVIRTNLLEFTETYVPYNKMYGTILAGLSLMLRDEVGRVYIASGEWYPNLVPSGSHVVIDESWSTENLQIISDGLEKSRLGKAQVVGDNDLAMQTLRVCWANPDDDYNCGRCEKCLRTMVNLQLAGALERCTTFAVPLSLRRVKQLTFFDQGAPEYLEENTRAAQKQPHNRRLFRALRRSLNRFYLLDFLRRMRNNYPGLMPNHLWLKKSLRRMRMR